MVTYEFDPTNGAEFYYFKWVEAEAALAKWQDIAYKDCERAEELQAKLAAAKAQVEALKGQTCATCVHWTTWGKHRERFDCDIEASGEQFMQPDFGCNRWRARP